MDQDLTSFCVPQESSIREAVSRMDVNRCGIVLVVDRDQRLVGTVTDGDVRRALLSELDFEDAVTVLLASKGSPYPQPITAPASAEPSTLLTILLEKRIDHLPLLTDDGRVVDLVRRDDFLPTQPIGLEAVIMAGGLGSRLRPLTEDMPKPMLPVGGRPLMEVTIDRLRDAGIKRVNVTTHHRPEKIREHFGNGQRYGVDIRYVSEDRPLGTVGGLGLLEKPKDTVLVINGDVLTHVDFRAMLAYHREHAAELTVGVIRYDVEVPYGVVDCDGPYVRSLTEKPLLAFFVNAGVFLLEPSVHESIEKGCRLDMTELIQSLVEARRPVVSFPIREAWLDIGRPDDYLRAQGDPAHWRPGSSS